MGQLENDAHLFDKIFDAYQAICPVCKNLLPEDSDDWVEAERLTDLSYGDKILRHPFNKLLVCSKVCKLRVGNAWQLNATKEKRDKLISEINEDNARFEEACIKAQRSLYLPKPKKKRYG